MGDGVSANGDDGVRGECLRCRRPLSHCYCALIPSLESKTRVVFLQHPRERHVAIGTARMAHLALPSSTLIEGTRLDDDARVKALFDDDSVAVLFPGEDALPLEQWRRPPRTLVVLDGTWWQAKKLLKLNPRLAALPRLSFFPTTPGNYRIRTEPSDQHLATIEAVAAVLGALEGEPERFSTMLRPFTYMVDRQIDAAQKTRLPRHRNLHTREPRLSPRVFSVVKHPARAVLLYAEANSHPKDMRSSGLPEVLHVVASRPHTGERFESIVRPRRELAPNVPAHLQLDESILLSGEDVGDAMARYRAFVGDDALLVTWGPYPRDLLAREGVVQKGFVDLRAAVKETLGRTPGGIPGAVVTLAVQRAPVLRGRAGRVLAELEGILQNLVERAQLSTSASESHSDE
jgi:DTW domain-containing protein YfiP